MYSSILTVIDMAKPVKRRKEGKGTLLPVDALSICSYNFKLPAAPITKGTSIPATEMATVYRAFRKNVAGFSSIPNCDIKRGINKHEGFEF